MDVNLITNASNVLLQSVVESSSNYIRYSNGIQICFDIAYFTFTNDKIEQGVAALLENYIKYPKPFIKTPVLYCIREGVYKDGDKNIYDSIGYHNISVVEVASSPSYGSVYIRSDTTSIYTDKRLQFGYIALGFWK